MIKKATIDDIENLISLAMLPWQGKKSNDLEIDLRDYVTSNSKAAFIYFDNDLPSGFAICGLRYEYIKGTKSSPIGYLEGIYVIPKYRRLGIGTNLLLNCENWARNLGCIEFASQCEITDMESHNFHINSGFQETNRNICFGKNISLFPLDTTF